MQKIFKNTDLIVGLLLSALALWYIKIATGIRLGASHPMDLGPRTLPMIYGSLLLVLSAILIIQSLRKKDKEEEATEASSLLVPVLGILLVILYAIALPKIGFVLSSLFLLLGMTRILSNEKRKWWVLVLIYLAFVLAISVIFGKWFLVEFPEPLLEIWRN